jgi:hypothetical protein
MAVHRVLAEGRFEYPVDDTDVTRARTRDARFLVLPARTCIAIEGWGDPSTSQEFKAAIATLYPVAYALQARLRQRGITTHIGRLEADWHTYPQGGEMGCCRWTLLIQVPEEAALADIRLAIRSARERRSLPAERGLRIVHRREERCVQIMHVGPYETEGSTIARLRAAVEAARLRPIGPHHEVYLSDPKRVAPERLRTLLRLPVG